MSVEVIKERGHTRESWLLLVLNLDGEFNFYLANAAQVGNRLELRGEKHTLTAKNGLTELQLVNALLLHHLQIVHLDDLFPHIGQQGEGEIAVNYSLTEGTILCAFFVNVYPLMVERGIGKKVDALLRHLHPVGSANDLAKMSTKLFVRIND